MMGAVFVAMLVSRLRDERLAGYQVLGHFAASLGYISSGLYVMTIGYSGSGWLMMVAMLGWAAAIWPRILGLLRTPSSRRSDR